MKRLLTTTTILVGLMALPACGRSDQNVLNDETAMNDTSMANAAPDPSNPFAGAEATMNQAMMAAVGSNAGDSWTRLMIAHHQGAISMSKVALQQELPAEVAKMARDVIDKQGKEISDLQKLLQKGAGDPRSMAPYQSTMMEMKQAMMNAKGANVSETFLRKMLAHHEGGAELADVALEKGGVTGALRAQVEKTHEGQHEDADMVEAMLSGKPMASTMPKGASSSTAAKASASSASPPRNATASKGMPVPGTNTVEHEAHDMNNMNHM